MHSILKYLVFLVDFQHNSGQRWINKLNAWINFHLTRSSLISNLTNPTSPLLATAFNWFLLFSLISIRPPLAQIKTNIILGIKSQASLYSCLYCKSSNSSVKVQYKKFKQKQFRNLYSVSWVRSPPSPSIQQDKRACSNGFSFQKPPQVSWNYGTTRSFLYGP